MTYDRRAIMVKAHELYRTGRFGTFANALRLSWADAKAVAQVRVAHGEVRTWFGWTQVGREVWHGEHAVAQVTVSDTKTKNGTRVISFFTEAQTCEAGEQPIKVR